MKRAAIVLAMIAVFIGMTGITSIINAPPPAPAREVTDLAYTLAGIGRLLVAGLVLMLAGIVILLDIASRVRASGASAPRAGTDGPHASR